MTDAIKIRVAVCGALGRMGSATCVAVKADVELELAAAIDTGFAGGAGALLGVGRDYADLEQALEEVDVDVVVDFTVPASVSSMRRMNLPPV